MSPDLRTLIDGAMVPRSPAFPRAVRAKIEGMGWMADRGSSVNARTRTRTFNGVPTMTNSVLATHERLIDDGLAGPDARDHFNGERHSLDVDQLKSNTLVPAPSEVVAIVTQLPSA